MRHKGFIKRFAALALVASLAASSSMLQIWAAPLNQFKEKSAFRNALQDQQIISVSGDGSGGITPTVFENAYQNPKKGGYRSRSSLGSSFDLRAQGRSTTVKDQAPWGSCWAFSAISSLESSRLAGASGSTASSTPDYSEHQLAWFVYELQTAESLADSPTGASQVGEGATTSEPRLDAGGNMPQAVAHLSTWQGAANEGDVPYTAKDGTLSNTSDWSLNEDQRNLAAVYLQNADFLPSPADFSQGAYRYDASATQQIKQALVDTGAVAIAYYADQSSPDGIIDGTYFNYTNYCQYVDTYVVANHGVSIVGWDDTYSKTNFNAGKQPIADGAWLIKNSWGDSWGTHQGYFWLSYYDQTITQVTSYHGNATDTYDNNYQYDYLGLASGGTYGAQENSISVANVFTANGAETLEAVSVVTEAPNSTVTIVINKLSNKNDGPVGPNAQQVATKVVNIPYSGYHTIKLDAPISLAAGESFSIVETIKDSDGYWYMPVEVAASASNQVVARNANESYILNDVSCEDTADFSVQHNDDGSTFTIGNAMIKAFTNNVDTAPAPAVQTLQYSAYSRSGAQIGTEQTISVNGPTTVIALPAGTASIHVTDVALDGGADISKQASLSMNGAAYALNTSIGRADLLKEGGSLEITTRSAPRGSNTSSFTFTFTCAPLQIANGDFMVTDDNAYLPAEATLTASSITVGTQFDDIKAKLEPMGGADHFYVYELSLSVPLKAGEEVGLSVAAKGGYPASENTQLFYYDPGTGALTSLADNTTSPMVATVDALGYFVVAQLKDAPAVPLLGAITYDPGKTLTDVALPAVEGGTWTWEDSSITPTVKVGSYAATFTPAEGSPYRSYRANIPLTVSKAKPVYGSGVPGSITYGQKLVDADLSQIAFVVNSSQVSGTASWKNGDVYPTVIDSGTYAVDFVPTDTDNYETGTANLSVSVTPKAVTVKAKDTAKQYGDPNPAFALEIPAGTLVDSDTEADLAVSLSCTADEKTAAGTVVNITGSSASHNYSVTVTPGELTVEKRAITLKVDDVAISYGEALPATFGFQVLRLVNGDTKDSIGATATIAPVDIPAGNLAGTYALKVTGPAVVSSNYTITGTQDGTLTIKEVAAGTVENSSKVPNAGEANFGAAGNLNSSTVLKITDLQEESALKAFIGIVAEGQKLGSTFEVKLLGTDGSTVQFQGALTLTIPVDSKYNGKAVTLFHYVKAGKLNKNGLAAALDSVDVYEDLPVTDGKIQVKVYSLSPFALVLPKEATPPVADSKDPPKGDTQVPTGDPINAFGFTVAAITAMAVMSAVATYGFRKRKHNK